MRSAVVLHCDDTSSTKGRLNAVRMRAVITVRHSQCTERAKAMREGFLELVDPLHFTFHDTRAMW